MDRRDDTDDANSPNLPPNYGDGGRSPHDVATLRDLDRHAQSGGRRIPGGAGGRSPVGAHCGSAQRQVPCDAAGQELDGDEPGAVGRQGVGAFPHPPERGSAAGRRASRGCDRADLPAGLYEWQWEGLDGRNTVFINLDYDLYPGLGAIGNTVWHDFNLDGLWDQATEPGIPGVVVNLYLDVDGNRILDKAIDRFQGFLTTVGNGFYKFTGLVNAKYLVEVDPGNFGAGGALEGYTQTPTTYDETFGDNRNRSTPWPVTMPTNLYYPKADFAYGEGGEERGGGKRGGEGVFPGERGGYRAEGSSHQSSLGLAEVKRTCCRTSGMSVCPVSTASAT